LSTAQFKRQRRDAGAAQCDDDSIQASANTVNDMTAVTGATGGAREQNNGPGGHGKVCFLSKSIILLATDVKYSACASWHGAREVNLESIIVVRCRLKCPTLPHGAVGCHPALFRRFT